MANSINWSLVIFSGLLVMILLPATFIRLLSSHLLLVKDTSVLDE